MTAGAGVTAGRRAALDVMAAVGRGRRLDRAFADSTRRLEARERAWCRELTYGVQRLRGRVDHLLGQKVRKGLGSLEPTVLDALRLGVYQILYMDGVPEYAAVSQSVELARSRGGRGVAGLVNAVLRGVARDGGGEEHFPDVESDPVGFFSTWGSHPRWLVERWLSRWSPEDVGRLIEADNAVPPMYLSPLWGSPEGLTQTLAAEGVEVGAVGSGTGCVVVLGGASAVDALGAVPALVQDPAAALVVRYADPPPGGRVADLCAAPGGKALALAGRGVDVLAADRSLDRLRLVRENVERVAGMVPAGRSLNVWMVQADALAPVVGGVDMVLLDVPCTGTGTLRRNPDARWKLTPERLAERVELQARILDACSDVVPKGGLLVYSTCSLEPEENEDQVASFLDRHPDFRPDAGAGVEEVYVDAAGQMYVLPQETGFDGAFAARLRRIRG